MIQHLLLGVSAVFQFMALTFTVLARRRVPVVEPVKTISPIALAISLRVSRGELANVDCMRINMCTDGMTEEEQTLLKAQWKLVQKTLEERDTAAKVGPAKKAAQKPDEPTSDRAPWSM